LNQLVHSLLAFKKNTKINRVMFHNLGGEKSRMNVPCHHLNIGVDFFRQTSETPAKCA